MPVKLVRTMKYTSKCRCILCRPCDPSYCPIAGGSQFHSRRTCRGCYRVDDCIRTDLLGDKNLYQDWRIGLLVAREYMPILPLRASPIIEFRFPAWRSLRVKTAMRSIMQINVDAPCCHRVYAHSSRWGLQVFALAASTGGLPI